MSLGSAADATMSPGATFDRVYHELKRMLAEGELPPGTPIEPALIGKQIASSITPIRDALHRLTGERLVEAPNHNGFRVPLITEAGLRDLYNWNGQILALALRNMRPVQPNHRASVSPPQSDKLDPIAGLFEEVALAGGNVEHLRTVEQLNDRLAPMRKVEPQLLDGTDEEHAKLRELFDRADRSGFATLLDRYHRRRFRAVPDLLAARTAGTRS